MKEELKQRKGITLIALVITIIVLLILAGVSIAMLTGKNGILTQANNAQRKTEEAEERERIQLAVTEAQLGDYGYRKLTEENLQKEIDEQFGSEEVRVYPNEKNAFSFIFQNKEANYRLEKDGTLNKIDIALKINNVDEFRSFMNEVNAGNTFENQYVYLMGNMDLTDVDWDVIGSYTDNSTDNNAFAGIFEGNNKTISGLSISKNQDYVGLFAYNTGTIRDIILESGSITGQGRVGGITAVNAGTIENCHNKGVTINITGNSGAGGIVARSTGEISYCSNSTDIISEAANIGGIVGALNYTVLSNCYNSGRIEGIYAIGGIIGTTTESDIKECYNLGDIEGKGQEGELGTYCGGIVGSGVTSKIDTCYNVGNIVSLGKYAGGIIGRLLSRGEVTNCYNKGIIENYGTSNGNIVGFLYSESKTNNCYFSKEICDLEGVGQANDDTTIETIDKTIDYMKTNSFVNDLNKDEDAFVISSGLNDGYPVLKWQVE